MKKLIEKIRAALSAKARRARRIESLRDEAQHHAEMAEMHGRAAAVYATRADELALADELAEAGLPVATDSDFSTFEEASRAHG